MKMGKLEKVFMNRDHHKKHVIERFKTLMDIADVRENQHFLEVGCGTGAVSIYCAQMYPLTVTGVDVDPEQIEMAQSYADDVDVTFLKADAECLPFEDETYDIVLSFGVMHHIPHWLDALQEINRVLKVNGHFIYWDIMYPGFLARIGRSFNHSYGITTLHDFNTFIEQNGYAPVHFSVEKSFIFNQVEGVFQKSVIETQREPG